MSIFCDDIRHEINGKMSLMGMYGNVMYVPNFPYTAPKLCAFFELRVRPDRDAGTDATLTVMKGAEKISSITLPITSFDDAAKVPHGKPFVYGGTSGGMEFPSITFTEPTLLEIAVQIDGQSAIGGRLWVTRFPQNEEPSA
jgi:hypothetical protein